MRGYFLKLQPLLNNGLGDGTSLLLYPDLVSNQIYIQGMGINPVPFIFLDDHYLIHGFSDGYSDCAYLLSFI